MMNRSRLSYKIFFTLSAVIFSLFLVESWVSYSLVRSVVIRHLEENLQKTVTAVQELIETSADLAVRSYLRSIAEQDMNILRDLSAQSSEGKITIDEAKQRAKSILRAQRIGDSGYVYLINSSGDVVAHPFNSYEGTNLSDQQFIKEQISRKSGFLEYSWKNPFSRTVNYLCF